MLLSLVGFSKENSLRYEGKTVFLEYPWWGTAIRIHLFHFILLSKFVILLIFVFRFFYLFLNWCRHGN